MGRETCGLPTRRNSVLPPNWGEQFGDGVKIGTWGRYTSLTSVVAVLAIGDTLWSSLWLILARSCTLQLQCCIQSQSGFVGDVQIWCVCANKKASWQELDRLVEVSSQQCWTNRSSLDGKPLIDGRSIARHGVRTGPLVTAVSATFFKCKYPSW